MSQHFEQTKAQRDLEATKQARRNVLRAEYNRMASNPFVQAKGEGGTVFDPAIQRYMAMRVSHYEHFKPTGYSARSFLAIVIPMFAYTYWMKWDRDQREKTYRAGEVSYKDRKFKFI